MKYFLIFSPDRGNREDCSVYYSKLVIAEDSDIAKVKFKISAAKNQIKYMKKNNPNNPSLRDIDSLMDSLMGNIVVVDNYDDGEDDGERDIYEILEINPIQ